MGSSIDLSKRLYRYYSLAHITQQSKFSLICKALLKRGYSCFTFEILEYCNKEDVLIREQYYLDLLKPEYNILKIAGSPLGYKHTEEDKEKMRGPRSLSPEHLAKISAYFVALIFLNLMLKELLVLLLKIWRKRLWLNFLHYVPQLENCILQKYLSKNI